MLLLVGMLVVRLQMSLDRTPILLMLAVATGFPLLFIMAQPDLGSTLIILVGIIAVAWFGELSMKPLILAMVLSVALVVGAILFAGFRMDRIDAWLDPWAFAQDGGYQIINSFYAFANGGISGVGLGMSSQKYLYLPLPHNDLIFPIIGEEFGLIGATAVVVLFLVFLFAGFRVAQNACDLYGRIVAGAATSLIGFQAFLNMLCMVNLLPMTGKPLPFFSAGGSSIIVTLMLVGLILNVSFRSKVPDEARARRDELLILDGGMPSMRRKEQSFPPQQLRRSPALAAAAGKSGRQQLRRPSTSGQPSPQQPFSSARPTRRSPVSQSAGRSQTNPALRMSPARNPGRRLPTNSQGLRSR
jgi:cell division protein FtsW